MKKILIYILPAFFVLSLLSSCNDNWDEHYEQIDPDIDKNVWEVLVDEPEFSLFVEYARKFALDSILKSSNSVTVFIPSREALEAVADSTDNAIKKILSYHIVPTLFLARNVQQQLSIYTLSENFASVSHSDGRYYFDGKEIIHKSSLYKNGIYYQLNDIAFPRLNIYEYLQKYHPVFADYIDRQDSVFLNDSLSKPIGFDDEGRTIYRDSVIESINLFERDYFPISENSRREAITLVIPNEDQYDAVINDIKNKLGLTEVPEKWQQDVLVPYLINRGMFTDTLEADQFKVEKMPNILGDSVIIDYTPTALYRSSNGFIYNYSSFSLHDSLFLGNIRIEGEELIDSIGRNNYEWRDYVSVFGELGIKPFRESVSQASKKAILSVNFDADFSGNYAIEFPVKNLFPLNYQFIWRGTYRIGAKYAIYANGKKIREFDLYNLNRTVYPEVGIIPFYPDGGYNQFDALIDNIDEFGDVTIRIEYIEPGRSS
ncbi:MAG: fasciclin domain-containing protein, partial [bacterium]